MLVLRLVHSAISHVDSCRPRPLVVLLGWLGGDPRHINKYKDIYEELGSDVIVLQPSIIETALPMSAQTAARRFTAQVLDHIDPTKDPPRPIFAHFMSNAGWLAFGTMMYVHQNTSQPQEPSSFQRLFIDKMRGVVIDSAPSLATPHIWSRGSVSAILGKPAEGIEVEFPNAVSFTYKIAERYLNMPSISRHLKEARYAWQHIPRSIPQLYLYSTNDSLIPASHVEAFMAQQEKRGTVIARHCWSDSGHCEHLKTHPLQYRTIVRSFIDRCLLDTAQINTKRENY